MNLAVSFKFYFRIIMGRTRGHLSLSVSKVFISKEPWQMFYSYFGFFHSLELYADGGHCGMGSWVQTMCLVKIEIDLGSSTTQ